MAPMAPTASGSLSLQLGEAGGRIPNSTFRPPHLLQALPANLLAAAGNMAFAAWGDLNMFANRERSQFLYTGLNSNPIAGAFFPYTTLMGWLAWSPSEGHTLTPVYSQGEGSATVTGFDTLFNGNDTYAFQYIFTTEIVKRPADTKLTPPIQPRIFPASTSPIGC